MAKLNRRWTLTDVTNLLPALEAIQVAPEYQEKLKAVAEGVKNGSVKYEEEYKIDHTANIVRWFIFLNGQQIKDFGVIKVGVEADNTYDDGRPIKLKIEVNSDSKVTVYSRFVDFTVVSVAEVHGNDTLIVTTEGNGQSTVWTLKPSS